VRMAGRVGASVVRAAGEGAVEIFMCIYAYYVLFYHILVVRMAGRVRASAMRAVGEVR